MPKRVPQYPSKPHKSGQARIKIKGQQVYLGVFGSAASHAKYHRVIAEYFSGGSLPSARETPAGDGITIAQLVNEHRIYAESHYRKNGKPTKELNGFKNALRFVLQSYAATPADKFGPRMLLAVRQSMIEEKLCGREINKRMGKIRRVWKWGVSRELVKVETFYALRTVEGVRKGQVRNPEEIRPVAIQHVESIKSQVSPQIWAMIQLQLHTGMRPAEVCIMRAVDVFADHPTIPAGLRGLCQVYIPESHKTEHHGKMRVVFIGPKAQEILREWLERKPTGYLFDPREVVEAWHAERVENATFHRRKPNRKLHPNPQAKPGEHYTTQTYGRAIRRACERFNAICDKEERPGDNIESWSPGQLRHTAATFIRQQCGAEVARVILGHSNLSTTEIYAERDFAAAAKAIREIG